MHSDNPQAFLDEATKAFETEKKAAEACMEHVQSCRTCQSLARWSVLNFLFRCRSLGELLFAHITAQIDADEFRLEMLCQQTDTWLEELYKLEDGRTGSVPPISL